MRQAKMGKKEEKQVRLNITGLVYLFMGGWMDGWMDGWMFIYVYRKIYR